MTRKTEISKIAEQMAGKHLTLYLNTGKFYELLELAETLYDLGYRYKEPEKNEWEKIYDVVVSVKIQKHDPMTNKKEILDYRTVVVKAPEHQLENNTTSVDEMIKKGISAMVKELGL